MSNITRNETMIKARDKFKATKEGAIAYANGDVNLAFAHGFDLAKKLYKKEDNKKNDT